MIAGNVKDADFVETSVRAVLHLEPGYSGAFRSRGRSGPQDTVEPDGKTRDRPHGSRLRKRGRPLHSGDPVDRAEHLIGQPLSHGPLVRVMDVDGIAEVGRHDHSEAGTALEQTALAVTEPGPGWPAEARQLDIMEGQLRLAENGTPAVDKQREQLLMHLEIMGIGLSLIPDDTGEIVAGQREDARLEKIAGLVRMARHVPDIRLRGIRGNLRKGLPGGNVPGGTAARPFLDEIIVKPFLQDGREPGLEGIPVDPRLGRGSAHRIADQSHGDAEGLPQPAAELIGDGRKTGGGFGIGGGPGRRRKILKVGQRIQIVCRPDDIIRPVETFHVEKMQVRIGGSRNGGIGAE